MTYDSENPVNESVAQDKPVRTEPIVEADESWALELLKTELGDSNVEHNADFSEEDFAEEIVVADTPLDMPSRPSAIEIQIQQHTQALQRKQSHACSNKRRKTCFLLRYKLHKRYG